MFNIKERKVRREMRRRIVKLIIITFVLTLTLSFGTLLLARSTDPNTDLIIEKLRGLQGGVSNLQDEAFKNATPADGRRNALENKIEAVVHQIEAGAFNGAVNKLQNDVRDHIEGWIKPEFAQDLIELVDEIIDLISGIKQPNFTMTASPSSLAIAQNSSGKSTITIQSVNNFNLTIKLNITSAPINGVNTTLSQYEVTPPPNGSANSTLTINVALNAVIGKYNVTVNGTSGSLQHSVKIKLTIKAPEKPKDTTPPTIASVQRFPPSPAYNESVTVTAFVYDTESGVKQVTLNYSGGSTWTPVNMTLSEGLYKANIPAFPFDTTVEYRVLALDNANNLASSSLYSYKVTDPYPPLLRIDRPAQGSYLSGTVAITVSMKDQNTGGESGFGGAELSINGTVVKMWTPPVPSEPDTYDWPTATFGPDGAYIIKLRVRDKAGNVVEKSLTVTVDNTLPSASINAPVNGSYLRLSTIVKVTGSDANFDKMEVRIDDGLVRTSITSGNEVLEWNTRDYADGFHSVTLTVYDKAGNRKQVLVNVTVDNTPPSIDTLSWSPKEPAANVDIQINVTVTEPAYGSGVKNVTLWFKNKTTDDWQPIPMTLKSSNWTATLSNQSDTDVKFFIEAFDKAENRKETDPIKFTVAAPGGIPLAWILLIILILAVLTGSAAYLLLRRRQRKKGAPAAPPSKPIPPSPPPLTRAEKPVEEAAAVKGYGMVSFVVPAHNEEGTISQRIARAYERAANHAGSSEIIVVDDGSIDNTYEVAWLAVESSRKKWPNIPAKVVKLSANLGREEAVRVGRNKATGEIVETVNGNTLTIPSFMGHAFPISLSLSRP